MSILSDSEIVELCSIKYDPVTDAGPMISPFVNKSINMIEDGKGNIRKILSYGLSSYGYDVRLADTFKIFTNVNSTLIDPKRIDNKCMVDATINIDEDGSKYVILPPNSYLLGVTMETFNIPRDVMVICLGKSTMARCFTGDTKIALVDNTSISFKEMQMRQEEGERFWGYSVDESGDIVVSELQQARKIGTESVIEIEYDNGVSDRVTPDHEYLLRTGVYCQAKDLKVNDSLFPLYRIESKGYEAVVQPKNYRFTSTHWLSDQWNIRNGLYAAGQNEHRHHLNQNKRDNRPTNIARINASDHIREHNVQRALDPEWLKKFSASQKASFEANSKDQNWMARFRQRCIDAARSLYDDDRHEEARKLWLIQLRERMSNMSITERRKRSDRLRKLMLDPRRIEMSRKALLDKWMDNEFRNDKIEHARTLNVRSELTEDVVRAAFESEGSIHGAARKLACDRTVFRRFKDIVEEYKERWELAKVSIQDMAHALSVAGSIRGAARLLGIDHNYLRRRKSVLEAHFQTPIDNNHKVVSIKEIHGTHDVYCLTAPEYGNFALESGVFVKNCGGIVNVTPIEPGFKGTVVIEIANASTLPLKIYSEEGIAQFLFFRGSKECNISYADKKGKYQNQSILQLPIV